MEKQVMENKIGYYQAKAETLMWEEGLVDNNWKFEYDNAKKRAGSCDSYKKCWWFMYRNKEGYLTKCNCVCGQPKLKIKENK